MKKNLDLDEIYADTWARRDFNLGQMLYSEYLQSEHWSKVKEKTSNRQNYKKCEFCDSIDIPLCQDRCRVKQFTSMI